MYHKNDLLCIRNCKVPLINIKNNIKNIDIDIVANNILGVYNSKLQLTYTLLNDNFRKLAQLVKYWGK